MRKSSRGVGLVALASAGVVSVVAASAGAAMVYTQSWDAGLEGWGRDTNDGAVDHVAAGGNPGGFIRRTGGEVFNRAGIAFGGPEVQGDYAAAGLNFICVDAALLRGNLNGTEKPSALNFRFRRFGDENGWLYPLDAEALGEEWVTFSASFDPTWTDLEATANGWVQEPAFSIPWATLMSNVQSVQLRALSDDTSTSATLIMGYDNFKLLPSPGTGIVLVAGAVAGLRRRR